MSDWTTGGYATWSDVQSVRRAQLGSALARVALAKRVAHLEDELAWTSTLAQALMVLCIEKGVVVEDELKSRIARIDEARAAAAAEAAKSARATRRPRRKPAR
jgi:hypothetical protein